jgi:hypothetical protein
MIETISDVVEIVKYEIDGIVFFFDFKIKIPEPNKERLITERDRLGRILKIMTQ